MALFLEPDESKMPGEIARTEETATPSSASLVTLSAAVKSTAPILAASNVALWVVSDEVNMEVVHCETMRKFKARLRAEDLEQGGFDPRDSAEECMALIVDVLSADDSHTVVVTPMAAPAEGSDTETASIKVPFSECEFLRIFFSIKIRTKLYEYTFVVSEQTFDAATRTQLQLQSLKQKIEAQSQQMEAMKEAIKAQSKTELESVKKMKAAMELMEATKKAMKEQSKTEIDSVKAAMEAMKEEIKAQSAEITVNAAMERKMEVMKAESKKEMDAMKVAMEESEEKTTHQIAALKSKGIASFRSNAMVERFRKWNLVDLAPTLDAMGALSEDQSEFRIGIEGVYRLLTAVSISGERMQSEYGDLQINGTPNCSSFGGKRTGTVLSFVGRLRVGDTVKVMISRNEDNDMRSNWLQIEKL